MSYWPLMMASLGKSSFARILVGDKWFRDSLPPLNDKDAAQALQGCWVAELSEMAAVRRVDIEIIKAFISRQVDKFRPPYGRRTQEFPRSNVFIGTTNADRFLTDTTGNRRFWPMEVGQLNFKALERDRLQLLAEAKDIWDGFEETEASLSNLSGRAAEYLKHMHAEMTVQDDSAVMVELMKDYYKKDRPKKLKMSELFEEGPLSSWPHNGRNSQFAGRALKEFGYEKYVACGRSFWRPR